MSGHLTQRRVRGYLDDTSEPALQDQSLVPSFEGPVTYSFPHQFYFTEQPNTALNSTDFLRFPYPALPDFTQQYTEQDHGHQQAFQEHQPHPQQHYFEADHQRHPRKRQRVDSTNMPIPSFISRCLPSQVDDEKPPVSGPSDGQDDGQASCTSTLRKCLGMADMRPQFSGLDTTAAPYDGVVQRAYSTDLLSPIHNHVPEHPMGSSNGPQHPLMFGTEESTHVAHLQGYPPLQPTSHLSNQPTTSPDTMVYAAQDTNHGYLKSEASPTFVKSEAAESPYTHSGLARPEENYGRQSVVGYQAPPPHYSFMHGYNPADGLNAEPMDRYQLAQQGSGLEVVMPNQKPPITKRGPFRNQEKRKQTAHCEANTDTPDDHDAPCDGCRKIGANSKIHRLPCKRWKITEVRLFKPGQVKGLEWTRRWKDTTMAPDICQWDSPDVKIIRLTEGYADGVQLRVRRFVKQSGDRLHRTWFENGEEKRWYIEPYALADLEGARAQYDNYLKAGLNGMLKALLGPKEKLLWRTYEHAIRRLKRLETPEEEKELIAKTLDLWAAVRLTTKSFQIIGQETLGIQPLKGSVPIPPVMGAQLDFILLNQTLPKLRRETLECLQNMTQAKKQRTWLTTYLVTFILLHNVALITAHDHSYAKKHGLKSNFARKDMVEQYHLGANIFLAYYHYCNKGVYPFSTECKDSDLQNLAELDEGSITFIKYTRNYAKEHKDQWDDLHMAKDYGNDYYFVRQLFEQNWTPQSTTVD
ncbi:hypothetical protein LA080_012633 [Diaporthe eres]|nr:hypothetical protein LA080_012633 [Diaporthe eres]